MGLIEKIGLIALAVLGWGTTSFVLLIFWRAWGYPLYQKTSIARYRRERRQELAERHDREQAEFRAVWSRAQSLPGQPPMDVSLEDQVLRRSG
ncbi:MAG: hypothetical protein KW804_01245 [Candidatus Doudnabacteria bacterium]|nr:hypothetical protein [Candidatus Doudnabacteria bacterium]